MRQTGGAASHEMQSAPGEEREGRASSFAPHASGFDEDEAGLEEPGQTDAALLEEEDFLADDNTASLSFKRKQKQPARLSLPKFLQPLPSPAKSTASKTPLSSARIRRLREQSSHNGSSDSLSKDDIDSYGEYTAKDDAPLDWYGDGPRRRVGYDNLTAIDWIFEYTKERQRLRMLHSRASGLLGQLSKLWDSSQVWLILVATGALSGILAGAIDITTDWLGDLRTGFCYSGDGGGAFYLSKQFCCWGHEQTSDCQDWYDWSSAMHIASPAGGYIVEYILFTLLSIIFAASASLLVRDYAPYAKHSGIPEIKTVLGGFVIKKFMGSWTLVIKSLGLCLAVASGLWLGKEGPLVHVACCCANLLLKLSSPINGNEARKREVLSAAASAGISVAFGSPIGGVLFSLEQLSYYFPDATMWQSFVCAMVASILLQVMNPSRRDQLIQYQGSYTEGYHGFEIVPFALLGVLGGIYGGLFIKLNMKITRWRRGLRLSQYPVLEVVLAALITALVNYPNQFMKARPAKLVHILFAECSEIDQYGICQNNSLHLWTITQLLFAAILGFLFSSATFGLKIPAGIILPSMAIGALYGRVVGMVVQAIQEANPTWLIFQNCAQSANKQCVTPGTYAIVGAAAALGGVTRMTVSIVVIMFELTGALTYVLPIMIAVMLSKWVGDIFGKRGIYESWIRFNEYPFLDNREDRQPPDIPVAQVMTRINDLATITSTGHTLQSLQDFLEMNRYRGYPIVVNHASNIFLGYISRTELEFAIKSSLAEPRRLPPETMVFFSHQPRADPLTTVDFRPWMDQTPITLNSKSTFQLTVDLFLKLGLKYVLLLDKGALQGLLTKKDVWYILDSVEDEDQGGAAEPITPRVGRTLEERGLLSAITTSSAAPSLFHDR